MSEHLQPRLGEIFRAELGQYQWSSKLNHLYDRLIATDAAIYERLDGQSLFSTALWELCAPSVGQADLWHYTTLSNLDRIIQTREIWLHSLSKRMGESELITFANEFGFGGLTELEAGEPRIHTLARDLFYLSLTQEDEPGDMWDFGEVRLLLSVAPRLERSHLRRMAYQFGPAHPLQVLRTFAKKRFDRDLVPWGTSRQGAFFLDSFFNRESEIRLLVKRFKESTDLETRMSGSGEAIAIPLSRANARADIRLLRVEAETNDALIGAMELLRLVPDWNARANVFVA